VFSQLDPCHAWLTARTKWCSMGKVISFCRLRHSRMKLRLYQFQKVPLGSNWIMLVRSLRAYSWKYKGYLIHHLKTTNLMCIHHKWKKERANSLNIGWVSSRQTSEGSWEHNHRVWLNFGRWGLSSIMLHSRMKTVSRSALGCYRTTYFALCILFPVCVLSCPIVVWFLCWLSLRMVYAWWLLCVLI